MRVPARSLRLVEWQVAQIASQQLAELVDDQPLRVGLERLAVPRRLEHLRGEQPAIDLADLRARHRLDEDQLVGQLVARELAGQR
jgi:hypothetical protein